MTVRLCVYMCVYLCFEPEGGGESEPQRRILLLAGGCDAIN